MSFLHSERAIRSGADVQKIQSRLTIESGKGAAADRLANDNNFPVLPPSQRWRFDRSTGVALANATARRWDDF